MLSADVIKRKSRAFWRRKAQQKTDEQLLRAPIDGTVQQPAIHTVGGGVSPTQ